MVRAVAPAGPESMLTLGALIAANLALAGLFSLMAVAAD